MFVGMRACCGLASALLSGKLWLSRIFPADYSSARLKLCFLQSCISPTIHHQILVTATSQIQLFYIILEQENRAIMSAEHRAQWKWWWRGFIFMNMLPRVLNELWNEIPTHTHSVKKVLKCLKGRLKESKKPISLSGGNLDHYIDFWKPSEELHFLMV